MSHDVSVGDSVGKKTQRTVRLRFRSVSVQVPERDPKRQRSSSEPKTFRGTSSVYVCACENGSIWCARLRRGEREREGGALGASRNGPTPRVVPALSEEAPFAGRPPRLEEPARGGVRGPAAMSLSARHWPTRPRPPVLARIIINRQDTAAGRSIAAYYSLVNRRRARARTASSRPPSRRCPILLGYGRPIPVRVSFPRPGTKTRLPYIKKWNRLTDETSYFVFSLSSSVRSTRRRNSCWNKTVKKLFDTWNTHYQ